ncbi:metal-dependent transcriptional regulator [Aminipila sp.]|jgi:Mn-dependent DtxR family transcriptional regulator|uniref:metal-dependent transcriptional regulator n=1 Tax=Aminipila sp. TaxID=2060095 RepID=UPI003FA4CBF6
MIFSLENIALYITDKGESYLSLGKSLEDYLEAILIIQHKNGMTRSVDIAEYMGFSRPSVSHAMKELKRQGYVTADKSGHLLLTVGGKEIAEEIYERHCFFTRLLTEAGVSPEVAENDACRIEHVISQESYIKLQKAYEKIGFRTDFDAKPEGE